MKKNVFGRKFKRDVNERKALFKSLMSSLVLQERIKTTEAKAKSIKGDVDKLITTVKKNQDNARRFLAKSLHPDALEKLVTKVAPRFKNRQGGYTRIIRLGKRVSDHAQMVVMEWVEKEALGEIEKVIPKKVKVKRTKKPSSVKASAVNKPVVKKSKVKEKAKPKTKAKSKSTRKK
jgi:large subunit ribosomal protein L17